MVARFSQMRVMPENGVLVFCGEVISRGDRMDFEYHTVSPPVPVKSFAYRCDSKFWLEDAENLIEHGDLYGLIVLDLHEACWGVLEGDVVRVLGAYDSCVPSKHGQGGQSAQRFERLRDGAIHEYFAKIGERANISFVPQVVGQTEFKGILIGGCGMTKDEFARGDFLHHELRKKVIGTFDTCYTNEYGLTELVRAARGALQGIESSRQKKLFDEFLKELAKDTGKAVYGFNNVVESVETGKSGKVLISSARNDMYTKMSGFGVDIDIIASESESGTILDTAFGGVVAIARYSDGSRRDKTV
jgi:peptide chain release factor subunit 1